MGIRDKARLKREIRRRGEGGGDDELPPIPPTTPPNPIILGLQTKLVDSINRCEALQAQLFEAHLQLEDRKLESDVLKAELKSRSVLTAKPYGTVAFYEDENGARRWVAKSPNHKIVGASSEGFVKKGGAEKNLEILRRVLANPKILKGD